MDWTNLRDTPPWEWAPTAQETLLKILQDRGNAEADRILAAELVGDLTVMDDQVADALLSTVQNGDEPEQVRARAAISLGPALELADTEGFDDDLSEPPVTRMMFQRIRATLRRIHSDERAPKEVRRRVLEASVRSPQDWHEHAIRAAYSSGDKDWTLTAVFCMRWIRGFDVQIIEMLESPNSDIHYEAVQAAGMQRVHAAWAHVAALMVSATTAKRLRLAAIEAAAGIRPGEARQILAELADSEDEEIAEAASEALLETDYAEEAGEDDEDLLKDFRH